MLSRAVANRHATLKQMVAETGIEYQRRERGIAHVYTDARAFQEAGQAAELMRRCGVQRRMVSAALIRRPTSTMTPVCSPRRWRSPARPAIAMDFIGVDGMGGCAARPATASCAAS